MQESEKEKMNPNQLTSPIHSNEDDISGPKTQASANMLANARTRLPLSDIINVQQDLTRKFDCKYSYLLQCI